MTNERTETGLEIETALPRRIVDDPAAKRMGTAPVLPYWFA